MAAKQDTLARHLDLPQGWREAPLGTVADVRFSSVDKLAYPSEDPVRLCNYLDVYKNDYITGDLGFMRASATQPEIDRFGLQVGDVIVTKDSETPYDIGIPAVVDYAAPDLVCGYHLGLIRPDSAEIDATFLAKQLGHARIAGYFAGQANGLTRYGLPIGSVMAAPLWLPPPAEQEAAGRLFRLVDQAIAQTQAVIAKLKQIRTGLLHDLLTCGLDENGEIRDPIANPEQFQHSRLGRVPADWAVAPLGYFLESAEYGISTSLAAEGELPVLRMNNFANGEAALADLKFATCSVPESLFLRDGDVLFNRTNSYEHVGRTGIWRNQIAKATFASYLVRLNPVPGRLLSEFLALALNSPEVQQRMRRFATPAVQQVNINPTSLRQMMLAAPRSTAEQQFIADMAMAQAVSSAEEEACLTKLRQLKSGLMSDLLTGRVRVPPDLLDVGP